MVGSIQTTKQTIKLFYKGITIMAVVTGADIYGSQAKRILGVRSETSGIKASGTVGTVETANTNEPFSWVIFVLILLFIRVLEEFAPSA